MAELTVYETNRLAEVLGLSFAQMKALDWAARQRAPISSREYRRAEITTTTMNSLRMRGLVGDAYDVGGNYWFVTDAGRVAITKAADGVPVRVAPNRSELQRWAELCEKGHGQTVALEIQRHLDGVTPCEAPSNGLPNDMQIIYAAAEVGVSGNRPLNQQWDAVCALVRKFLTHGVGGTDGR